MITKKKCTKCKMDKGFSEFHKNKNTKHGIDNVCKACRASINRMYYEKKASRRKERQKELEASLIVEELEKGGLKHGKVDKVKLKKLKFDFIDYPSPFFTFSMNNVDFCKKYNLNIESYLYIRKRVYENKFEII